MNVNPFSRFREPAPAQTGEYDMLVEERTLPLDTMPAGEGWRMMTGGTSHNVWARVVYRHEAEAADRAEALTA